MLKNISSRIFRLTFLVVLKSYKPPEKDPPRNM